MVITHDSSSMSLVVKWSHLSMSTYSLINAVIMSKVMIYFLTCVCVCMCVTMYIVYVCVCGCVLTSGCVVGE